MRTPVTNFAALTCVCLGAVLATSPTTALAKEKTTWRGTASIDMIYDDNILANSPEYRDDFAGGAAPGRFVINSLTDLITAPALDIRARTHLMARGTTRFRFKVKRWLYAQNAVKNSTDYHFFLRQYLRRHRSLALYYQFTPEIYVRHSPLYTSPNPPE